MRTFLTLVFLLRIIPAAISADTTSCYNQSRFTVRGNSLEPIIKAGKSVEVLTGYYNCNPVLREDIVVYNYSGNKNPIIKVVKGIPGDTISLSKNGDNYWNILINGEILRNSENIPYQLTEKEYKIISLYIKDYNGVIPENTYLIMGNKPKGSLDSRRIGLVDKKDIVGKVIRTSE